MSKRYSNKGYQARQAAAAQPKTDNVAKITAICAIFLGVAIVAAVAIALFAASGGFAPSVDMDEIKSEINSFEVTDFAETDDVTNYVKITVKGYGDIVVRLRPDIAPKSVKNFQNLVQSGHYEGKTFHRVVQNFMIQGGGYVASTGKLLSTTTIEGEFTSNGYVNNLKHVRGVLSMARTDDPNSATNQFFICDATSAHLDGNYASFGYVLAGMDTVDKIAAVKVDTTNNNKPIQTVEIEKVTFVDPLK